MNKLLLLNEVIDCERTYSLLSERSLYVNSTPNTHLASSRRILMCPRIIQVFRPCCSKKLSLVVKYNSSLKESMWYMGAKSLLSREINDSKDTYHLPTPSVNSP